MLKILPIILLFFSCNGITEPDDCAGVEGGSAEFDACGICSGPGFITFEKVNNADWTLPENQDSISNTIVITRKNNQSLYNIKQEDGYSGQNGSPMGTLWALSPTAQANAEDYVSFVSMHGGGSGGGPGSLLGDTLSLYLPDEELYFDIILSSYSGGDSGGGFAWKRICINN